MCLVWVRSVLCETNSSRAICGPLSSLSSSLSTCSSRSLNDSADGGARDAPGVAALGASPSRAVRCLSRRRAWSPATPSCSGVTQQLDHGGALVQEEPHVASGSGARPRPGPRTAGPAADVPARRVPGPAACGSRAGFRRVPRSRRRRASRSNRPAAWSSALGVVVCPVLRDEQTHEGEVVELAQIAGIVRGGHPSVTGPVGGLATACPARSRPGPSSPRWDARPGRSPAGRAAPPGPGV